MHSRFEQNLFNLYVLPYGQMSLWGATVITNLLSAIPWIGGDFVESKILGRLKVVVTELYKHVFLFSLQNSLEIYNEFEISNESQISG